MTSWHDRIMTIEALEDAEFHAGLVADMQRAATARALPKIRFSTPTFKEYDSTEVKGCGKNSFPAFSITAGACALDCDHCQAKILEPMIPATKPEVLDQKVRDLILLQGLQGFLLSGGSNRRNEIRYERFYPVIEGLKRDFPGLKVAIHTALTDEAGAKRMEAAGVDTAMMDVIGSDDTIREVYHLDRPVEDFEATLAAAFCLALIAATYFCFLGLVVATFLPFCFLSVTFLPERSSLAGFWFSCAESLRLKRSKKEFSA